MECKLADYKNIAGRIEDAEVHFAFFVAEDAETGDFGGKPFNVGVVIGCFDAKQD